MKPARPPAATPQISTPRAFAASRSLPAKARPDGRATARPSAIARSSLCIADLPPSFILAPLLRHPCPTVVEACARDYLLAEQSLMQDHCRLMLFRTAGACPERSRRIRPLMKEAPSEEVLSFPCSVDRLSSPCTPGQA